MFHLCRGRCGSNAAFSSNGEAEVARDARRDRCCTVACLRTRKSRMSPVPSPSRSRLRGAGAAACTWMLTVDGAASARSAAASARRAARSAARAASAAAFRPSVLRGRCSQTKGQRWTTGSAPHCSPGPARRVRCIFWQRRGRRSRRARAAARARSGRRC